MGKQCPNHVETVNLNKVKSEVFIKLVLLITKLVQGDQKVSVRLMMPHFLAQSDCLAADRKDQGDTRLTLTPSVIPDSNYFIMVSD
jgi:hypothetical protein